MPLLGLDNEDLVDWDIVSGRSCARGVTAQNVFRMMAPASNMVMMYGIGGIGMTTMAPNALLMEASSNSREGKYVYCILDTLQTAFKIIFFFVKKMDGKK